jgi:preprotein translocase subunit SecG
MGEKFYWGLAALLTVGIVYAGLRFYQPLLTSLHVLVCLLLLMVVLLQSGRAADLAGAFGGAGSQTAFGPRGAATFLSKATTFLAVVFMVTSLTLAIFASSPGARSVVQDSAAPPSEQSEQPEPATPGEETPGEEAPGEAPAPAPQE